MMTNITKCVFNIPQGDKYARNACSTFHKVMGHTTGCAK